MTSTKKDMKPHRINSEKFTRFKMMRLRAIANESPHRNGVVNQ